MSSPALKAAAATPAAAAATDKPKRKRVRKQKTAEEQEAAWQTQQTGEEGDADAEGEVQVKVEESAEPSKKKVKRSHAEDAAAATTTTKTEAQAGDDDDAQMVDAEQTGGDSSTPHEKVDTSKSGGGYLSEETLNYYRQLSEVLERDDFENAEEKDIFLTNVIEELCGANAGKLRATTRRGVAGEIEPDTDGSSTSSAASTNFVLQRLCSHAKISRLLQKLMDIATAEQVAMFLNALQENVVDVLSDRYGSHVLEAIFFRLPALLAKEQELALENTAASNNVSLADATAEAHKTAASRLKAAWKNLGTHSAASVGYARPHLDTLPLRCHFFTLVTRLEQQWLTLSQHAHGSFGLRHIIHILVGEADIKALADSGNENPHASNSANSVSSAAATATSSTTPLPLYLGGCEELLPWVVQELLSANDDDVDACVHSPSAVPVFQSLLQSIGTKLFTTVGGEAHLTHTGENIQRQLQTLLAKILRLKGEDHESWLVDEPSQSTKNYMATLLTDRSGSRLMESVFQYGNVAIVHTIFEKYLKKDLLAKALHPITNFVIQHLFNAIQSKWGKRGRHMLRDAFDILHESLEELRAANRSGVILKFLDACIRVQIKENKLFKQILALAQEKLQAQEGTPEGISNDVLSNPVGILLLSPAFKAPSAEKNAFSTVGSLMIQSCLMPAKGLLPVSAASSSDDSSSPSVPLLQQLPFATVMNAFLNLPQDFLMKLAHDHTGSHLFDAFASSPASPAMRQQLLRKFQMKWVELAMNPAGSFVVETLFKMAPNPLKVSIAGDLVRAEKRVMGSRCGAVLFRKLRLEHFKRHQPSWLSAGESSSKPSKPALLFEDLLADGAKPASEEKKGDKKGKDKNKENKSKEKPVNKEEKTKVKTEVPSEEKKPKAKKEPVVKKEDESK